MKPSQRLASTFVGLVIIAGFLALLQPLPGTSEGFSTRFVCYLLLALLSSGLKVTLPGVTGTLSVSFLFILAGMAELGGLQTMVIGIGSASVSLICELDETLPAAIGDDRFGEAIKKAVERWRSG